MQIRQIKRISKMIFFPFANLFWSAYHYWLGFVPLARRIRQNFVRAPFNDKSSTRFFENRLTPKIEFSSCASK